MKKKENLESAWWLVGWLVASKLFGCSIEGYSTKGKNPTHSKTLIGNGMLLKYYDHRIVISLLNRITISRIFKITKLDEWPVLIYGKKFQSCSRHEGGTGPPKASVAQIAHRQNETNITNTIVCVKEFKFQSVR